MSADTARWVSVSRFGSPYEEEADANSHPLVYRYRLRAQNARHLAENEWRPGRAPEKAPADPRAALEAKMRAAAKVLDELDREIHAAKAKAYLTCNLCHDTKDALLLLADEFAAERATDHT